MTELELYKKMYAGTVGGVDDTLLIIAKLLVEDKCDRNAMMEIGEKLKKVLLDAEELYLDAYPEEPL